MEVTTMEITRTEMDQLKPASEVLEVALTAEDTAELKAVAYAINSAASTGEVEVLYQGSLREATEAALTSKGYKFEYISRAHDNGQTLISWAPKSN